MSNPFLELWSFDRAYIPTSCFAFISHTSSRFSFIVAIVDCCVPKTLLYYLSKTVEHIPCLLQPLNISKIRLCRTLSLWARWIINVLRTNNSTTKITPPKKHANPQDIKPPKLAIDAVNASKNAMESLHATNVMKKMENANISIHHQLLKR